MRVAVFDSPGLREFGASLDLPLAVVAATPAPRAHIDRLVREEHGCWRLREDWCFGGVGGEELDPLFPQFQRIDLDPRWMGRHRLPTGIAIEGGTLLVVLSHRNLRSPFAIELKARLACWRHDVVGARPGLVLRRRATGRPVIVGPLYSRSQQAGDGATAFEVADDIYAFRPKLLPALVAAVAAARDRVTLRADVQMLLRCAR
jgi:hypothetical protein